MFCVMYVSLFFKLILDINFRLLKIICYCDFNKTFIRQK